MNKNLDIIMDICEQMLVSGAEVSRVEECVRRLGKAFGASRADAFIITSNMEITLHDSSGVSYTQTRRISSVGTDIERLHRLNSLTRSICGGMTDHKEIDAELRRILALKKYPFYVELIAYIAISSAFTVFFGGGPAEAICAAVIGGVLAVIVRLTENSALNRIFTKFLCSFAATVLAFTAAKAGLVPTEDNIIIGNIMTLIPGVGITVALRDLFVGDSITGVLRTIEVVLFALAIAGGYFLSTFIMGGGAV